ncbi:MAG: hypothetical protein A3H27_06520 [Acidobacteria bacterium RIFCSPLOWO2_02_FULL_59_13]|nr:MAG: hypothetical protein A3H27_06520 [Acidobacteria bacterium RIFCSPLOWO2_02_FULL_59_13]
MEPEHQNMLLFLAIAITVVLFVQTILLWTFVITFRRWYKRTEALLDEVTRNAEPVLRAARDLLTENRERLQIISTNLIEITQLTKNQVVRVDGFLAEASDRARLQLVRMDDLLGDTMQKFQQTTETIQRSILGPVRELSAILAGVRTTLDFLFRRDKKAAERATQDEELFI